MRAIHEVLRGMVCLSPRVSRTLVQAYLAKSVLPADPLTPREREVLKLVVGPVLADRAVVLVAR